jgi:hypothetical protein
LPQNLSRQVRPGRSRPGYPTPDWPAELPRRTRRRSPGPARKRYFRCSPSYQRIRGRRVNDIDPFRHLPPFAAILATVVVNWLRRLTARSYPYSMYLRNHDLSKHALERRTPSSCRARTSRARSSATAPRTGWTRSQAHLRDLAAHKGRPPEVRPGVPRARQHFHNPRHLQPRHTGHGQSDRGRDGGDLYMNPAVGALKAYPKVRDVWRARRCRSSGSRIAAATVVGSYLAQHGRGRVGLRH